jgi:hypothetical protein
MWFDYILLVLFLLFVKHWYIDFVDQTQVEVENKGKYGKWLGVRHSLKHGIGTAIVFVILDIEVEFAVLLGIVDFVVHYHVDWIKMRFGNRDITTPAFWNQLGLDQLAHYTTYLALVWVVTI